MAMSRCTGAIAVKQKKQVNKNIKLGLTLTLYPRFPSLLDINVDLLDPDAIEPHHETFYQKAAQTVPQA